MIRKLTFASVALGAMFAGGSLQAQTNGNCNNCPPSTVGVAGHAHGAHLHAAGSHLHGAVAHVGQSVHAVGGAVQGHMLNYGNLAASGANANGFGSNAGWVWHSSWEITGLALKPTNGLGTVDTTGCVPVNRPHWWCRRQSPCNRIIHGVYPKTP